MCQDLAAEACHGLPAGTGFLYFSTQEHCYDQATYRFIAVSHNNVWRCPVDGFLGKPLAPGVLYLGLELQNSLNARFVEGACIQINAVTAYESGRITR